MNTITKHNKITKQNKVKHVALALTLRKQQRWERTLNENISRSLKGLEEAVSAGSKGAKDVRGTWRKEVLVTLCQKVWLRL